MAKRKLSAEARAELRAYLKKTVGGKQKTADVLRDVAKKYGITTITARWYLKSVDGSKKADRRGPGHPAKRLASTNGDPYARLKRLRTEMANTKAAAKIAPRLERLAAKEDDLDRSIAKLQRSLKATSKKAKKLRNQYAKLMKQ